MSERVNDYRSVRRESVELLSIPPFGAIAPHSTVFPKLNSMLQFLQAKMFFFEISKVKYDQFAC